MSVQRIVAMLGIVLLGSSCGGDDVLKPGKIEKVTESDNQSAPAGGRLASPLAVIVKTADGTLVPRTKVRWQVNSGGQLADSASYTDATGRAQVDFTVGASAGSYEVRAQLGTNASLSVTFTTTATPPPNLASVTPSTFTGGDVVTIAGTNLSSTVVVEIGSAPAQVTAASTTSITAVVPVCLAPGVVPVRARLSGSYSNSINGTFVTSPINLAVGAYASIDPALVDGCATFPAAGIGGAEYLVAPQSVSSTPGITADFRLSGDQVITVAVVPGQRQEPSPPPAAQAFHDFLRGLELEISKAPRPARPDLAPSATAAVASAPKVGDQRDFSVCSKNPCINLADFTTVHSRAKYVGSHVAIFQDNAAPAGGFTDAEFAAQGQMFNDVLYEVNSRAFGVESDVDQNSRVFILLTPIVNGLTPTAQCSAAVIVGFFYAIDIDPGFAADKRSNQAEVFYSVTPDPQGSVTCTIPKDRIGQIVPSTFIHEFQHMISYGQHVIFRAGQSEDLWLNEAMSHLAEELGGLKFRDMGDNQAFSDFVIGDLFDAYQYLKAPDSSFVMYSAGSGTLAERGASWLFLRWLVDKFGPGITRRMVETQLTGSENIASAVGEPLSRLLSQWFLANWVSDLPGFTAPERLRYETWHFRTTYASLNQQQPGRYTRPYPLVPTVVNSGTFVANGTLRTGSGNYFRVVQAPAQNGFTLRLTGPGGVPLGTAALPRLNIIRIK